MPLPVWKIVNDNRPDESDYPCTIIKSMDRDLKVWTAYIQPEEFTEEVKQSAHMFFRDGENLQAEDWFPKPC